MGAYIKYIVVLSIGALLIIGSIKAQNNYTYTPSMLHFAIPDTLGGTFNDSINHIFECDFYQYDYKGMLSPEKGAWIINNETCRNIQKSSYPFYQFCELIDVYKSKNRRKLLGLYSDESREKIESFLSNDSISDLFFESTSKYTEFEIIGMFESELGLKVYAIPVGLGKTVPYYMDVNGSEAIFKAVADTFVHSTNIMLGFYFMDVATITTQFDADADGTENRIDNCPCTKNPLQKNSDRDKFGDKCDNCAKKFNPLQTDMDMDDVGDVCDNCPSIGNEDQKDSDGDSLGDICDNCPNISNKIQKDKDADSIGDVCDNCPDAMNPTQADKDNDGIGDACDTCPDIANPDQKDNCDQLKKRNK